jgi:hypothetical protein
MLDDLSGEQTTAVRNELKAVISSDDFSGSKRCQDFLRLIVECRLAGDLDSLRERMIGAKMFGRNVDYDTSNDAVVRVRATEVRKRLAHYYSKVPGTPAVRIELRPGTYVPEFRWRSQEDVQNEARTAKSQVTIHSGFLDTKPKLLLFAAGLGLACLIFVIWLWRVPTTRATSPVQLSLGLPQGLTLHRHWHPFEHIAVSPDGRILAFAATDSSGQSSLWVRSLSASDAHRLDQTEGALLPFWSPDSQFIGFWANGKLKRIRPSGGVPAEIYSVPEIAQGSWGADGTILFARAVDSPIFRISPHGQRATPVTSLLPGQASQMWVQFLPDGKHFMYLARTTLASSDLGAKIYVQALDGGTPIPILASQHRAIAVPDYLLFAQDRTLLAQRMDWENLRKIGAPRMVSQSVGASAAYLGTSEFTASQNGVLIYGTGEGPSFDQLNWYGRDGTLISKLETAIDYEQFTLSPDGTHIALNSFLQHATGSLWLVDLASNITTPLTIDPRAQSDPVWSPDSRYVAFDLLPNGGSDPPFLVQKIDITTQQPQLLYGDNQWHWVEEWSSDGRFLLTHDTKTFSIIPLAGEIKPKALYSNDFIKDEFHLSPDRQQIAYGEVREGRWEVFVASFPSFQHITRVSVAGGAQPRWRGDGRELFFLDLEGKMMSVSAEPGPRPKIGIPRKLFDTRLIPDPRINQYAVTKDGGKFLVLEPQKGQPETYSVVLNWPGAMK